MAGKTHLIIPDQHAHPDHNNDRADWMGQLIKDIKPDLVVNIGDAIDLPSLSSFDKGKAQFHGNNYGRDIDSHLDFQERLWAPIRHTRKKLPYRVFMEGNHEFRIKKVLEMESQLDAKNSKYGISFRDLDLNSYYNEVHEYEGSTPAVAQFDGVSYAHFFVSGVMGKPIGGVHHANTLINKMHTSCTCGHSHLLGYAVQSDAQGNKLMGCVTGVGQDYYSNWAGEVNRLWDHTGGIIKREVENGVYDLQVVSMKALREAYGY